MLPGLCLLSHLVLRGFYLDVSLSQAHSFTGLWYFSYRQKSWLEIALLLGTHLFTLGLSLVKVLAWPEGRCHLISLGLQQC